MKARFYIATIIFMIFCSAAFAEEKAEGKARFFLEPTLGSWYGTSNDSHWYGAFSELTLWREDSSKVQGWSPGADFIVIYSHGRETASSYKWTEKTVGGGPALKYANHEGIRPWQWQLKARVLFEQIDGDNPDTTYKVNQRSILLNPYMEYVQRINDEWIWGATAEGRIAVSRSIDSSWSNELASNRNTADASVFAQRELNENLQGRLTVSGVYQGWDKKSGIELSPELRIKETVMLGIQGALLGRESVLTGYVRIELGKPLRDLNIF